MTTLSRQRRRAAPPAPREDRPAMDETCDRCGPPVSAAYRVEGAGELWFCLPCTSRLWKALSAQGWVIWPLGVHALAPQMLAGRREENTDGQAA